MTKKYDHSVFKGTLKLIDENNLQIQFSYQNLHEDSFHPWESTHKMILKNTTISEVGVIIAIKIPQSVFNGVNNQKDINNIVNTKDFSLSKLDSTIDLNFKGILSKEPNNLFSYVYQDHKGIVLGIISTPKQEELRQLKTYKPNSNKIYNGENNKYRKCEKCLSRTFTNICLIHKVPVHLDNTCNSFTMQKELLGGLPD